MQNIQVEPIGKISKMNEETIHNIPIGRTKIN